MVRKIAAEALRSGMYHERDLARAVDYGGADRIVRHESPLKWSVDPMAYLLEKAA